MIGKLRIQVAISLCTTLLLVLPGFATATDDLLIENGLPTMLAGRAPRDATWVLVKDGRIAEISAGAPRVGKTVRRIDGGGKFLIPGLIDSHIHLDGGRTGAGNRKMIMDPEAGIRVLHGYLYSGVTSVYDSGNHDQYITKMRADERAGAIISPRIFATISLIAPVDGHGCCAGGTTVENYAKGVEKLEAILAFKPDLLKFTRETRGMGPQARNMPLLADDLFNRLIRYANERGVRTTVHVSEQGLATQAIEAGANAFAHLPYLGEVDDGFANLVAARGVIISTTLTRNEAAVGFYQEPAFAALLTPEELAEELTSERHVATPFAGWLASLRPAMFHNVRQLYDAGALLALGTDRTFGAMPHQELKLLVEAGIPPLAALRMGTLNAAMYIGVADELGSIEPGKLADMVLLNQDPVLDIGNTTSIAAVFKAGQQIDRSQLSVTANER